MQTITRVDASTGETLVWCGGADFNIIQTQKKLNNAGMSLLEIREDKWATVGHLEKPGEEEVRDGR